MGRRKTIFPLEGEEGGELVIVFEDGGGASVRSDIYYRSMLVSVAKWYRLIPNCHNLGKTFVNVNAVKTEIWYNFSRKN